MKSVLLADGKSSAVAAVFACAVLAALEIVLSTWASPTFPAPLILVRFAFIALTLSALLAIPLTGLFLVASLAFRAAVAIQSGRGWAAPRSLFAVSAGPSGPGRAGAMVWGVTLFSATFVAASTAAIRTLTPRFKEPLLTAGLISVFQLSIIVVAAALGGGAYLLARRAGARLHPRLGAANPLGRAIPAIALVIALFTPLVLVLLHEAPHLRPLIPWRLGASALAALLGVHLARRLGWVVRRRRTAAAIAATYLLLVPATLLWFGADPSAKSLAVTSSPALARLVDGVRRANDFDGDGYGSLLGETDCAPFNAKVHPLAPEIPDNGADENCDGRDLLLGALEAGDAEHAPVPEAFKREWNVLLITVDTVRYDHTSFGGYLEKTGRDTTPNLAELVRRSASFSFSNAPSAGTMASIPAILTSKFFHSGIALGPNRRGIPPVTKPENLLVSEMFKDAGYQTGALLTHYYFNDWGLDQGFDTYDNSIGEKSKPEDVSSDILTDRAVSWIANHSKKKWFLWTHYLDPHGRYVTHPGEVSYGTTEKDIYDGELHYTDKHLGRLFREIARIPGIAENTIVVVTSDHGDAFNEHGFINHGQALYRELLWVPLIIYVPSIAPRVIPGAVSPLDIVPTLLDLVGIDRRRFAFEGKSLVSQLFYGTTDSERIVFAETDWPKPQRAAIGSDYKLIRKIADNLFELYDLKKDPLEKKNIYRTEPKAFERMNAHLESWLERVYYARDDLGNQQMLQLKDTLLDEKPAPRFPVTATYDEGRLALLGFDIEPEINPKKGNTGKISVSVYFEASARPRADFKIEVTAISNDASASGGKPITKTSRPMLTAKGRFPTSRWRAGEFVRHEALIPMGTPPSGSFRFVLELTDGSRSVEPAKPSGALEAGAVVLGTVLLDQGKPSTPNELSPSPPSGGGRPTAPAP